VLLLVKVFNQAFHGLPLQEFVSQTELLPEVLIVFASGFQYFVVGGILGLVNHVLVVESQVLRLQVMEVRLHELGLLLEVLHFSKVGLLY